jgi:predicted metal-dependent phosphoesterase TrpH
VELSTRWKSHDIHILGLGFSTEDEGLHVLLEKQQKQRKERAIQISRLLETVGVAHAFEKACQVAQHDRIGRPHFAQVLVNEGMVTDLQTAFKRYLGRGRVAYVPTLWIGVDEAVNGIVNAQGLAVLAHPLKYKLTRTKLHALVSIFKDAGGIGIEVVSGEMKTEDITAMANLSQRFHLLASSGSDYHSDVQSRVKLGQQKNLPLNCSPVWEYFKGMCNE